jgi:hypothetical protein
MNTFTLVSTHVWNYINENMVHKNSDDGAPLLQYVIQAQTFHSKPELLNTRDRGRF